MAEYKLGGSTRALCGGHHIGGEEPYLERYVLLMQLTTAPTA